MSKFEQLCESEMERFQQGGFMIGDRIRFKKDALKHAYISSRAQSFIDIVKACMDPTFDLNLRIGAIKSVYPATTQNYGAGVSTPPDMVFFDVYIEYAPGLYRNPMTIPLEVIEVIDDGNNRGPVPDSVRRKNKIHGPEKVKANSSIKAEINLTNQNVKLPGSNKWDDTQPGGGNFKPKK
jgi:hypothetical protein